jgi:exosortase
MGQDAKPTLFQEILRDTRQWWRIQPNKLLFFGIFIPWLLLFHFWGNITLGYVKTDSLFGWMKFVYTTSPDDEHGMLIPFVVIGLFWWKRKELWSVEKKIWFPAFGIILVGVLLHLLGYRVQQTRLSMIGFFTGIYGMLGLVWGKDFMKKSFFPMFLFVFCIPLGTEADRITSPLRLVATKITSGVAHLLGIGVLRDGTRLFDPNGLYQYEVAAACSGVRSLMAIFAFGTILAFTSVEETLKKVFLIFSAFPFAVFSNVIRLLAIVFAAELFGQDAGNYVHESSWMSLLPYVPAVAGMIFLGRGLQKIKPFKLKKAVKNE